LSAQVRSLEAGLDEGHNTFHVSRLPANYVVLQGGTPILAYEHGGDRWKVITSLAEETMREAILVCLHHLTRSGGLCAEPTRVHIREWKGTRPIGHTDQPLLESLGFRRETPAMVWDGLRA